MLSGTRFHSVVRILALIIKGYFRHWFAAPAAAFAAVISTVGAATVMWMVSPVAARFLNEHYSLALFDAIVGPLFAYIVYLLTYYSAMFWRERAQLRGEDGLLDEKKYRQWLRVVRFDYLAHVPSDVYLISLAAIMQFGLEMQGMGVFSAVLVSQFVDDFITFLKEPAIWAGANSLAAWESSSSRPLAASLKLSWFQKKNKS